MHGLLWRASADSVAYFGGLMQSWCVGTRLSCCHQSAELPCLPGSSSCASIKAVVIAWCGQWLAAVVQQRWPRS